MIKEHIKKQPVKTLLIVLVTAVICLTSITIAKYMMQKEEDRVFEADKIYFTSDYLKDKTENAVYYVDPADTSFSIQLFNFADALRVSDKTISYTVTAEGATIEKDAGELTKDAGTEIIPIKPATDAEQIVVTASATSPYQKTLQATFIRKEGNEYQIEDQAGNNAAILTLTSRDNNSEITLMLPDGVLLDQTDEHVEKKDTNTYIFHLSEPGVYSVVLLKSKSAENSFKTEVPVPFASKIDLNQGQKSQ